VVGIALVKQKLSRGRAAEAVTDGDADADKAPAKVGA